MRTALLFFILAFPPLPSDAAGKLRVVATVPELVDMTRRIGGDRVAVDGIARGTEDIHQVVMRPSMVTKLNRADAVVFLGMTIEHSFLVGLLDVAVNRRARPDRGRTCLGEACIDCSVGLDILDKPATLSRAEGELHPEGNPHYNMSPGEGPRMARLIQEGLSQIDPAGDAEYRANLKDYLAELEPKLVEWRKWVEPLRGLKAVSVHKDTAYIARFTGLEFVGTVELKPGVAATPSHLVKLVELMKAQDVKLIVREQQFDPKQVAWLAEQTGAEVAVISTMAGAFPGTDTFIKASEHNLKALLKAAGKERS